MHNDEEAVWQNQLVSQQSVSIIGPAGLKPNTPFPDGYQHFQWVLPSQITEIRSSFDAYCAIKNFKPNILAEADDMAMLRLLVRDTGTITALPSVVVKDEIANGQLSEYQELSNIYENFYAITAHRKFVPEIVNFILSTNQNRNIAIGS